MVWPPGERAWVSTDRSGRRTRRPSLLRKADSRPGEVARFVERISNPSGAMADGLENPPYENVSSDLGPSRPGRPGTRGRTRTGRRATVAGTAWHWPGRRAR